MDFMGMSFIYCDSQVMPLSFRYTYSHKIFILTNFIVVRIKYFILTNLIVIRIKRLYLLYNLNGIQFKSRIITEKFIYLSNKSMAEFHKNITLISKVRLQRSLVSPVFPLTCEEWTLNA